MVIMYRNLRSVDNNNERLSQEIQESTIQRKKVYTIRAENNKGHLRGQYG